MLYWSAKSSHVIEQHKALGLQKSRTEPVRGTSQVRAESPIGLYNHNLFIRLMHASRKRADRQRHSLYFSSPLLHLIPYLYALSLNTYHKMSHEPKPKRGAKNSYTSYGQGRLSQYTRRAPEPSTCLVKEVMDKCTSITFLATLPVTTGRFSFCVCCQHRLARSRHSSC